MSMSYMFWWDPKSSESKEPFKFHSPCSLLICSISACSQHQYLLSWLNLSCDLQKERRKERKKKERTVLQKKRVTFYEKTLNHKSKPCTSYIFGITGTSHLFLFNSKYPHISGNLAPKKKKKKKKKNTLHFVLFLFISNITSIFLCVKLMEKWYDMRTQDVVDIMHWNCLAWQQSTSSGHPFFHPNHETAPTKSIPFQHVTIPGTLVCAFYHQHCWVQIGFRQMKWRLAHCT